MREWGPQLDRALQVKVHTFNGPFSRAGKRVVYLYDLTEVTEGAIDHPSIVGPVTCIGY